MQPVIFIIGPDMACKFQRANELVKGKKAVWMYASDLGSRYRFRNVTEETECIVIEDLMGIDDVVKILFTSVNIYIEKKFEEVQVVPRPTLIFVCPELKLEDIGHRPYFEIIACN